jgi:RNA polymerase sigma factor (sigma-70 family)
MSQATLADTLSDLCRRAVPGPDALPDGELLRRFAEARDQAAFAALLRRHARVVWGAAVRRTADPQAAEDVFQATFLALARRAGRLHGRTSLAGWLYTVGARLARRAARKAMPVSTAPVREHRPGPLDTLSARELLAALDDEIGRLPKAFRLPVVLCCLDGLSRDEAAQRLGCSFGALKGRLERGRELLRRRLAARGISLSAVLGGLVVLPAAVPPEVVAGTANAVLGGTPRPAATALAGSLGTGRAAGFVVAATTVLLGLGLAVMPGGGPPADPKPPAKDPAPAGETLAIRVVRDGKPAAGVTVWAAVRPRTVPDRPVEPKPRTSGADGEVRVPVDPDVPLSAAAFARDADGRIGEASVYEHTLAVNGPPVVHLVPVGELTGRLRTADGKPVVGAEVQAVQFNRPDDGHEPARPNHLSVPPFLTAEYTTRTDADGRFRIRGVPVGYRVYSPLKTDGFGHGYLELQADQPADVTLLPAGSLRLKLAGPADAKAAKGVEYRLQTATPGGTGPKFIPQVTGTFDGSAELTIANVAPGRYRIDVRPDAKYPVQVTTKQEVLVNPGATAEVAATVEPMAKVTGRVVDAESGKGVPKATVYLQVQDGTVRDGAFGGWVETDADGRFVGYAPPGMWVRATIHNPPAGYAARSSGDVRTIPQVKLDRDAPQALPDIKLRRAVALRAKVVDHAGKRVGGATVWTGQMQPPPSHPVSFTTRPDGSVTLPDLGPDDVLALRVRKGDAVNMPTPVELAKQDGPATIELNEKHACRVRGQVTDDAGKPLAGVRAVVMWQYQGLGADASMSTQRGIESVVTDADGRFTSGALWPTDRYQVTVSHERYSRGETKEVKGEAGQVHDLGSVRLVAVGKEVRGKVVGTDGQPLAGVTVMQRGDGPAIRSASTGPDGSFTLGGYFDRPGFVLVRHDGYRPTAVSATPGGAPVTVTVRKTTEPPAPPPPTDGYEAALKKFTRELMEKLWADREHLGGFEKNVFSDMARFDPGTARRWRDTEKERTGGKVDHTPLLDEVELDRTLPALARADLDEALARIPKTDRWQVSRILTLAEQLLGEDRAKALRAAEEAAVRARALDPAERPWSLARAGDLGIRAGNAAGGKKLIAEAIELATKLPDGERHEYYRGLVAAAVAAHDESAAHKLIDGFGDPDRYNRALAGMVARLADTDPKRAEALFGRFRPGLGFSSSEARLVLGFKLAAGDPERAEAVVASTPEVKYRLLGFARLATLIAAKDRPRAWRLIDRAMDLLDQDPRAVQGWSGFGGAPAIAALVAVRARQAGHPDVGALVARALAQRTAYGWESRKERDEQTLSLATVLASADPPTARTLLNGIAPPAEFARRAVGQTRDWLFAAALADPEHAGVVVDAVWSAARQRRGGGSATSNTGLIELLSVLTGPGDRLTHLATYGRIPSIPDRPD